MLLNTTPFDLKSSTIFCFWILSSLWRHAWLSKWYTDGHLGGWSLPLCKSSNPCTQKYTVSEPSPVVPSCNHIFNDQFHHRKILLSPTFNPLLHVLAYWLLMFRCAYLLPLYMPKYPSDRTVLTRQSIIFLYTCWPRLWFCNLVFAKSMGKTQVTPTIPAIPPLMSLAGRLTCCWDMMLDSSKCRYKCKDVGPSVLQSNE